MRKVSESEVDYSRGHRESHCGKVFDDDKFYCRYFIEPPTGAAHLGACEKVSGAINRTGAGCGRGRICQK
jgi:hypothetical protein